MLIQRNLTVPLRDGVRIYIDLYRPPGVDSGLPVLLGWSPYGKHGLSNRVFWPASGVDPQWLSPLTAFEAPDPVFWCQRGYAVVFADPRGAWQSEGEFHHNGIVEAADCRDTIDWLGAQSWSNGRVGMTGVSYLAAIQYYAAALRPAALAAINPWEGFADWYREFATHGGIPETGFIPRASDNIRFSLTRTEDTWANVQAHPLWDAYWKSKEVELEAIHAPAYVVASWSDQGLHTRGTLEVFKRISSRQQVARRSWAEEVGTLLPRREPPAAGRVFRSPSSSNAHAGDRLAALCGSKYASGQGSQKSGPRIEWPLARTQYRKLWLDGGMPH